MSHVWGLTPGRIVLTWTSVKTPKKTPEPKDLGSNLPALHEPHLGGLLPQALSQRKSHSSSHSWAQTSADDSLYSTSFHLNPTAAHSEAGVIIHTVWSGNWGSEGKETELNPCRANSTACAPNHCMQLSNLLISRQQAKSEIRDLKTIVLLPIKRFQHQRQCLFLLVVFFFPVTSSRRALEANGK